MASDDLPEPLGPQNTVIRSRSISARHRLQVMLLRALHAQLASRPGCGRRVRRGPRLRVALADTRLEHGDQRLSRVRFRGSGRPPQEFPSPPRSPPAAPPSGPRSITQSAVLMTSRLCSTTSTVLPASTKLCSTLSSIWMSAKCRPVVGSSSKYSVCAGAAFDQFAGQLDALGFASRERRRGLAQLHVVQAHVVQRLQFVADVGDVLEQLQRLLHVHFQHFRDRLALELDLQRLVVVAVAPAHGASHPHVGQEVHLQSIRTVAFACLATTAASR